MEQQKPALQKQSNVKIITFIIAAAICVWLFFIHDWSSKPQDVKSMDVEAYIASEHFITKKLKAPATASFPTGSLGHVTYLGDSVFFITSYVDAQNSFGANLRTNYTAKIKYQGGDYWLPLEINLLEN